MIVMKFGGSALQTPKKVRSIAQIVRSHIEKRPVLVLSAMGTTTDDLLPKPELIKDDAKDETLKKVRQQKQKKQSKKQNDESD